MATPAPINYGQYTDKGIKPRNQDSLGVRVPNGALLRSKGAAAVIADGVSSSDRGHEASGACVTGFLEDYFSTPDSWSVQKSVQQVLAALNTWLYNQGHAATDAARGMLSTLSILITKSTTAHLFHIGDSRLYRLRGGLLEQLTVDHKTWLNKERSYLSRAMGADTRLEIDYKRLPLQIGDLFLLSTDGIHDHVSEKQIAEHLTAPAYDLSQTAAALAKTALEQGSEDNLTCLLLRVESLPAQAAEEIYQQLSELPFPPPLAPGMVLDSYRILRELHASSRTQLYLAEDLTSGLQVAVKTPSVNYEDDPAYIEQFITEEWVGRRVDNPHVMKVLPPREQRRLLYSVAEFIDGQTLRQWLHDHPQRDLETVRGLVEQIARGLQAFQRLEMTHRDLKPENILISHSGMVKLVDFGSTRVAGIAEISSPFARPNVLGTRRYMAPEHFRNLPGDQRSDIFSLGVITYELLTGELPYAVLADDSPTAAPLASGYRQARIYNRALPAWLDACLRKAVHPDVHQRYPELSEFLHDLRHPNPALTIRERPPLIERNPVGFWRGLALLLLLLNLLLLYQWLK